LKIREKMNQKVDIETLFRSKLETSSITPSPGMWKRTLRALRKNRFWKPGLRNLNIYYLAAATLVAGGISLLILNRPDSSGPANLLPQKSPGDTTISQSTNSFTAQPEQLPAKKSSEVRGNQSDSLQNIVQRERNKALLKQNSNNTDEVIDSSAAGIPEIKANPVALFELSTTSGCVPLKLKTDNWSQNASRYTWTFGDGGQSTEIAPSVTFTEAGSYIITLTAFNSDGVAAIQSKKVEVLASPISDFDFSLAGEQIYFTNYSGDAVSYAWSYRLGNGPVQIFATDAQPSPLYFSELYKNKICFGNNEDSLIMTLKTTDQYNCSSSITRSTIISRKPPLSFPNVFSPNQTGSSSGSFTLNSMDNSVFHPVWKDEPRSYHLRIFNRSGELIFETTDIYTGWDGYYAESPADGGVYVWQCEGTDVNGDPYILKGDITLLKK